MNTGEGNTEQQCARCGACTVVCPVFRVEGRESLTARGKMHLLALPFAEHPSGHFQDIFSRCLLCGACEDVCSRKLPVTELVIAARSRFPGLYGKHGVQKVLARKVLSAPALLQALVRAGVGLQRVNALPAFSGLRLKLGLLEDRSLRTEVIPPFSLEENNAGLSYFTGCLARYLQPSITHAVVRLAESVDETLWAPESQTCCGLAATAAGRIEEARDLAWQNMQTFAGGQGPILTSCASCSSHLVTYPDLFADDPDRLPQARAFSQRVVEFSTFFSDRLSLAECTADRMRVFYHDPCHLRFTAAGREMPRQLLDHAAAIERVEAVDGPRCCGQGGLFHLGYPDLSREIFQQCAEGALEALPDMVVTTCSGCLMQWQQGVVEKRLPVEVNHLALLLANCLG